MKAIVANVIFGGIFGCLSWSNSACAIPLEEKLPQNSPNPAISAKLLPQSNLPAKFFRLKLGDRVMRVNRLNSFNSVSNWQSEQQPYSHQGEQVDLLLGFQNTFWPSENKHKYWGVTTVEHWGKDNSSVGLTQLNYINSAPVLASGSSVLTFSGGGNDNLGAKAKLDLGADRSQDFKDFRGGITYHHGVAKQLTMGVGFVYEDRLVGFTQLTYDSDILPIRTTFSLLARESKSVLHTHVRFQPAPNIVANYYHDAGKDKFDLNWEVAPKLALIAKGDSQQNAYSTGIKFAVQNDFFSLSATAALDNQSNLEWKLSSQIGRFKFAHSSSQQKSSSELDGKLVESEKLGFQCSTFVKYQVKYQTPQAKQSEQFMVWGGKFNSTSKISPTQHHWNLTLGYGSSSHGTGFVAQGAIALQPSLFLKLDYQTISAVSDDTKVKLQLSSN